MKEPHKCMYNSSYIVNDAIINSSNSAIKLYELAFASHKKTLRLKLYELAFASHKKTLLKYIVPSVIWFLMLQLYTILSLATYLGSNRKRDMTNPSIGDN